MACNYRIVRHPEGWFGLHEVSDNDGISWMIEPITFVSIEEGKEEIIRSLKRALRDAKKYPVIDLTEDGMSCGS